VTRIVVEVSAARPTFLLRSYEKDCSTDMNATKIALKQDESPLVELPQNYETSGSRLLAEWR
jgi:hypothetical protein